jgi:hypothetical protein
MVGKEFRSRDHGMVTIAVSGSTKCSGLNAEALHLKVECLVVDPEKSSGLALVSSVTTSQPLYA